MSMGIIAGVVTVAGTAYGAYSQSAAAKQSARAQQRALNEQQPVDIEDVRRQAREADEAAYRAQFQQLREVDPRTAELRKRSDEALLSSVLGDPNVANANQLLSNLFSENVNIDPRDTAFQDQLKSEATRQLGLGGQLSPEQQAELVRAGLVNIGTSGFDPGSTAARQQLGGLLASEQETLAARRQEAAKGLFGFATDLQSQRNQALLGIQGASTGASVAENARLLSIANLADARTPQIGLTGGDIANLAVGNVNQANQVALQRGAIDAQRAQANAQIAAGLVGGITGAVSGIATRPTTTRTPSGTLSATPSASTTLPAFGLSAGQQSSAGLIWNPALNRYVRSS